MSVMHINVVYYNTNANCDKHSRIEWNENQTRIENERMWTGKERSIISSSSVSENWVHVRVIAVNVAREFCSFLQPCKFIGIFHQWDNCSTNQVQIGTAASIDLQSKYSNPKTESLSKWSPHKIAKVSTTIIPSRIFWIRSDKQMQQCISGNSNNDIQRITEAYERETETE